jgi:hypothetical protein
LKSAVDEALTTRVITLQAAQQNTDKELRMAA